MKMKMLNGIRIALASCLGVVAILGMSGMARADFINGQIIYVDGGMTASV